MWHTYWYFECIQNDASKFLALPAFDVYTKLVIFQLCESRDNSWCIFFPRSILTNICVHYQVKQHQRVFQDQRPNKGPCSFHGEKFETLLEYHLNSSFECVHYNTANLAIKVHDNSVKWFLLLTPLESLFNWKYVCWSLQVNMCMASHILDAFMKRLIDIAVFCKRCTKSIPAILVWIWRHCQVHRNGQGHCRECCFRTK